MTTKAEALLQNYDLSGLHLKNRIVMAPMTRSRAGEVGLANEMMAEYYAERASAGLIISEGTQISEQAAGWLNVPRIDDKPASDAWKQVTKAVHDRAGKFFMQLWHCGRASHSSFHQGKLPVAPSAIKINGDYIHAPVGKVEYEIPRALEIAELPMVVQDYKKAAQLAKDAGFDGVEIHSANGYLLDEFLQSKTNHRTDAYGGSIENRFRLLGEVVDAVIDVWGPGRVAVRLSPNGIYNDMGSKDFRETFLYVAEQLDKRALAYLHVLDGLAFGFHELGAPLTLADFRSVFEGTLMANCGYDLSTAEEAIKDGQADLIAFGRPFISNPDLVERFTNGWELNPPAEMKDWYSFGREGYLDFPKHSAPASVK